MVVTLGYWDVRGMAHAIRLLLEYTGTPYKERQYSSGPASNFDPSDWTKEKEKLGLDFPNLPYLIDGSTKLTQSNAILRYIARKHNMCGETEQEKVHVDMLENHLMDLRLSFIRLCYSPDFLTFIDFLAYDVLDQQRMFVPDCPELQGNLSQFLQRFEALEKVGAYMRSGRFMKTPIFLRTAQWCTKKE